MRENCKHLQKRKKIVVTTHGVFYGNEYKCELQSGNYVVAKKICCRRCPKQINMFEDDINEKRYNR